MIRRFFTPLARAAAALFEATRSTVQARLNRKLTDREADRYIPQGRMRGNNNKPRFDRAAQNRRNEIAFESRRRNRKVA
jgi:hypothetical protein